jgi:hypothetical protein
MTAVIITVDALIAAACVVLAALGRWLVHRDCHLTSRPGKKLRAVPSHAVERAVFRPVRLGPVRGELLQFTRNGGEPNAPMVRQ